ncbi:hypothetical protein ACVMIH_007179 [Bradyrhizobium sp. USDA 4503]
MGVFLLRRNNQDVEAAKMGCETSSWWRGQNVVASAGALRDIVDQLAGRIAKLTSDPETRDRPVALARTVTVVDD